MLSQDGPMPPFSVGESIQNTIIDWAKGIQREMPSGRIESFKQNDTFAHVLVRFDGMVGQESLDQIRKLMGVSASDCHLVSRKDLRSDWSKINISDNATAYAEFKYIRWQGMES